MGVSQQTLLRADAALRARRPAEALGLLGPPPWPPQASYLAALALSSLGRITEADDAFEAALRGGAPRGRLRRDQGNAHRLQGDAARALRFYDDAASAPDRPDDLDLRRGQALATLGRTAEAEAALRAQLRRSPRNVVALNALGGVLNRADRPREAAAVLDRALALRPDLAAALNNRAAAARAQGDLDDELALMRRATTAAPNHAEIRANAARAAARQGLTEEAIEAFQAAIRLAPLRADIHRDLNRFAWEAGRRDVFLRSYDGLPAEGPSDQKAMVLSGGGALALAAGNRERASALFEDALALQPHLTDALAGRARAAPPGERERLWRDALTAKPNDPDLRLGLAWHLLGHGAEAGALEAERLLAAPVPARLRQAALAYDGVAARLLERTRYRTVHDPNRLASARTVPVPAGYGTREDFLSAVAEAVERRLTRPGAPVDQTLFGGQQTEGTLWASSEPALAALKAVLETEANAFFEELRRRVGSNHPLSMGVERPLVSRSAWAVRLRSGGGHRDHIHGSGVLSSAHYVLVPAMRGAAHAGALRLGRPDCDGLALPPERIVHPEPGLLVLFPSYVWHGVERFEADGPRVTTPADFSSASR